MPLATLTEWDIRDKKPKGPIEVHSDDVAKVTQHSYSTPLRIFRGSMIVLLDGTRIAIQEHKGLVDQALGLSTFLDRSAQAGPKPATDPEQLGLFEGIEPEHGLPAPTVDQPPQET